MKLGPDQLTLLLRRARRGRNKVLGAVADVRDAIGVRLTRRARLAAEAEAFT